jgi:hypothetical protein
MHFSLPRVVGLSLSEDEKEKGMNECVVDNMSVRTMDKK